MEWLFQSCRWWLVVIDRMTDCFQDLSKFNATKNDSIMAFSVYVAVYHIECAKWMWCTYINGSAYIHTVYFMLVVASLFYFTAYKVVDTQCPMKCNTKQKSYATLHVYCIHSNSLPIKNVLSYYLMRFVFYFIVWISLLSFLLFPFLLHSSSLHSHIQERTRVCL